MTRARLIDGFLNTGIVSEDPDHCYKNLNRPTAPFCYPSPAYSAPEKPPPDYEVPVNRANVESAIYQVTQKLLKLSSRMYVPHDIFETRGEL